MAKQRGGDVLRISERLIAALTVWIVVDNARFAIVTNALFVLGASFLIGGLKYHVQEFNRASARLHAGLLLLAAIALVSPSAIVRTDVAGGEPKGIN